MKKRVCYAAYNTEISPNYLVGDLTICKECEFLLFYIKSFSCSLREVHGVCAVDRTYSKSLKKPRKHLKDNPPTEELFLKDMLSKLN